MAIKIQGVTVINDSRGLENITSGLTVEVRTPEITFPADGATGLNAVAAPNIKVTAPYHSAYGVAKKGTEVQISTNSNLSSPLVNSNEVGTDTTFLYDNAIVGFATNTTYYARVRHYDINDVYSEWSSTISFTTPSSFTYVVTPTISSPTDLQTEVGEYPTITSSTAFATSPAGQDTHASSDWQIATDADFTNIVDQSINDTSSLTSYTSSTALSLSTTYYARVRYNSNNYGSSEWSSTVQFTTAAQFAFYWMAMNTDVEKYGDSYMDGGGVVVDDSNNRSYIALGGRSTSFEIHRYGRNGTDEGRLEYQSILTGSSTEGMGAVNITSSEACAAMHYNGNDEAYFAFLDISNGGFSHNNTYRVYATSHGTMRGVSAMCSAEDGESVYAVGQVTSSYDGYYIYRLKNDGTILASKKMTMSEGGSYTFPRGVMRLSNGHVIVTSAFRNSSNVNYYFYQRWDANLTTVYDSYYLTSGYQNYSSGNNQNAIELSNGNVLFCDWQFIMESNVLSGGAPTVERTLSITRSDRVHERNDGNILITTSQTRQAVFEYEPSGSSYNFIRGIGLDYTVGSDEWSGTDFDSVEQSIYGHGRAYSGSVYNGHIHKVPADLTEVPLNSGFPDDTRWNWSSATPTSSNVTANVVASGSYSLYNPTINVSAQSPTIGSFAQNTTFYDYE